jgi:hypothetical protein
VRNPEGLALAESSGDLGAATGLPAASAVVAAMFGRHDEARSLAARALADARVLHQPMLEAAALIVSGYALATTNPAQAVALMEESIALTHATGNEVELSFDLLADIKTHQGDIPGALQACRQAGLARSKTPFLLDPFYVGLQVFNRVGRSDLVARSDGHYRRRSPDLHPCRSTGRYTLRQWKSRAACWGRRLSKPTRKSAPP